MTNKIDESQIEQFAVELTQENKQMSFFYEKFTGKKFVNHYLSNRIRAN